MPIFSYKGLDRTGKDIKANITAENLNQAKQKVKSTGIMLVEIKEQKSDTLKKQAAINLGSGVNSQDLSLMTRQLATLIKARIQIVEAFNALIDQTDNPKLKVILSEIKQKVNEGSSLAKALGDYPKVFNHIYVNMVDAGEASGTLDLVLIRLADFQEAQEKLKNRVKSAMMYPMIMAFMGFAMMNVIFIFVIPKISKIFKTMKKELPLPTKISIGLSDFFQNYWWLVIIGGVAGAFLFKRYISSGQGQERWHSFTLKVPKVGKLITMINVGRFCSTLGTLLNSGVPILTSMKIVKNLVSNVHMQKAIEESRSQVQEGASMVGPLVKSGLFPSMVTHMIKLGERSGELEPMLNIIADNYQEQVDAELSGLTSLLEPIMLVGMGGAVGFIVFSVIMPMMEMNKI